MSKNPDKGKKMDVNAPAASTLGLQANGAADKEKTAFGYHFTDLHNRAKGKKFGWHYEGDKSRHLGEFDLELLGKIVSHNPETQKWDKIFLECQLFWPDKTYTSLKASSHFLIEISELLSVSKFREILFKHTFKNHNFYNDSDLTNFYQELTKRNTPKTVFEFDHYGFIRKDGHHFYLTENALITIPKDHDREPQYIIAPDESGMFPYISAGSTFFVKPGRVDPPPSLRLPRADDGIYPTDGQLFDDQETRWFIHEVRENLGELVAGQKPHLKAEGYMIFAFMMSFFFFEEIYDEFKHVVYLYIWGEPSTGKGKLSQIMLHFFGQSFTDVDSSPTLKSAENKLANHSQTPVVMDEFHPDKSKISSQIFNMWYELRQRGVSASHDRSKNAWSPVRSQILFISNFKPTEDHFRSRCLMIEYAREKRGRENIVFWFNAHEVDMQKLFKTMLFRYNNYNRSLFKAELHTTKQLLSQALTAELERRKETDGIAFQVKDRQIENMTALVVTDMFICNPAVVTMIENYQVDLKSDSEGEHMSDFHNTLIDARTETAFFEFAVQFLANSAEREVQQTPLQQFLATLEVISEKSQLNSDYHREYKGDIIFYWSGIWDEYTKYQQGREVVPEKKLRDEIEAYDVNGKAKTHKISKDMHGKDVYRHGYRVAKHRCSASWYRAFGHRMLANELVSGSHANDET